MTDRTFANFPIERGAEFIHGDDAGSWPFIRKAKLATTRVGSFPEFLYEHDGALLTFDALKQESGFVKALQALEHMRYKKLIHPDESLARWMLSTHVDRNAAHYIARYLARINLSEEAAIGIDDLLHEARTTTGGENDFRVRDGYDGLINHLANNLDIRLSSPVTNVTYSSSGVTVRTKDGASHDADKVIVTIPVSLLQQHVIEFHPILPSDTRLGIAAITMGSALKIHLKFSRIFWDPEAGLYVGEGDAFTYELPSRGRKNADAVMNAFITGHVSDDYHQLSEHDAINRCLADLCRMFQSSEPKDLFIEGACTFWGHDPWTRGAYSFIATGNYGAREALAEPVQNVLYFAGEAAVVEGNPATVHGAMQSGINAATMAMK